MVFVEKEPSLWSGVGIGVERGWLYDFFFNLSLIF